MQDFLKTYVCNVAEYNYGLDCLWSGYQKYYTK